ncbi:MAG: helix-turn-helix domain-containing protein [Sandaracinaceae bacterium]
MRVAKDPRDLLRDPFGACVLGPTFVYFCARPRLCGFALFGRPNGDDLRALERCLLIELDERIPPHGSLCDASRVGGVDATAFAVLHAYVERHRAALATKVERLAIVRPPGLAGATVAGFFSVAAAPYPSTVVSDVAAALAWLEEPDDGFADALAERVADASGAPPLLVALHTALDALPGRLTLEEAARGLGLSSRSLQRKLRELDTTFQAELAGSQVRIAKRLLRDSSASLTAIALEVGCATPQHFSTLFRRITGKSPSAWRSEQAE